MVGEYVAGVERLVPFRGWEAEKVDRYMSL